ncbi:DUF1284 domain-containing protein [Phaeovulum sp. W22_SRMD_FR3]|uniref:DUF1284 domain-containing protein n=1 Tax=Phaeovulum sp. W22_SRMD_FR3 TaxID=3240274 RepID=UPI003F9BA4E2
MRLSPSPRPETRAAAERRARLARAALAQQSRGQKTATGATAQTTPAATSPEVTSPMAPSPVAPSPVAKSPMATSPAPGPLRYRPHHFLCSLGFEGKGYSPEFTANMTAIVMGRLRAAGGPEVEIEVTTTADDICTPCPARIGQGCESQGKIEKLDRAHAAALGLTAGDRLRWGAALDRMRALPEGILSEICAPCQWLAYGMCEAALARLRAQSEG